ncbi:hypothetical protein ACODM8_05525 [Vibrio ostreicida]|uniref:hypothetical protein n=1 Tax=Vibrio ostreicida TaxID=526588 RepID=UPI003B5C05D7
MTYNSDIDKIAKSRLSLFSFSEFYYFFFLVTFSVIIFSNLLPASWVVIVRPFSIVLGLMSVFSVSSRASIIFVIFLYSFLLIYSLLPLIFGGANLEYLVKNTWYIIYFLFLLGLANIMRSIDINRLLYSLSRIFVAKLFVVALISFNMNFSGGLFSSIILDVMSLSVHKLFGAYRVLDVYLFLFPLAFVYVENKRWRAKVIIHSLLLFNVISSLTIGIIFAYIIIMLLKYSFLRVPLALLIFSLFSIYFNEFYDLYQNFLDEKSVSIDVKLNQVFFIFDNLTIFGQGLGKAISIQGRVDSTLENVYIYWLVVYGIVGSLFMIFIFVMVPLFICYRFRHYNGMTSLFYLHLSILLVSASNPFLESVVGIIPMMLILSFGISRLGRKSYNKININTA